MIAVLYATAPCPKEATWSITWLVMRLALKLISHSFSLNWGYAPVSSFDKSLFYQNLFCTLRRPLPASELSSMLDSRNFSAKWLVFKTQLTPLAGTVKKTISGFDTRLSALKGPKQIKGSRRKGLYMYQSVAPKGALGGQPVNPLLPFISQGQGWGVRSSKGSQYLGSASPFVLKKTSTYGLLDLSYLPKNIIADQRDAFLKGAEAEADALSPDSRFLVSSDLFLRAPLLTGKTFLEGKVENPNLIPQSVVHQIDVEDFDRGLSRFLAWAAGSGGAPHIYNNLVPALFYKGKAAERVVALSA